MKEKIVLGLSGGVDSALAAALLKEQGRQVTGVYLDNGLGGAGDARRTAEELGIDFRVVDMREALEEHVCGPFRESYLRGETPLPCGVCNGEVKFPLLLAEAEALGAERVATGHYARSEGGALYKGKAPNDQSYMLARLSRAQLARCVFPLGGMNKAQARARAAELGLTAAEKPDSMEICFIPDGDHGAWIEGRGPTAGPGEFVDTAGRVLGRHRGIYRYTVGQGSGLGLSDGKKWYVSAILPGENRVVLSDGSDLFTRTVMCRDMNWLVEPERLEVTARFRHSRTETPAVLYPDGRAECREEVRAATPGQLAVFYLGDRVAAGGWIKRP